MRHVRSTRAPGSAETVPIYIPMMRRALCQGREGDMSGAAETLTTAAKIMSRCDDPRAAQVASWARELLARASRAGLRA